MPTSPSSTSPSGRKADHARKALAGLFKEAEEAQRHAHAHPRQPARRGVSRPIGYAGLARGYLKAAQAPAAIPYREPADRPLSARQWRLTWASLTGRI